MRRLTRLLLVTGMIGCALVLAGTLTGCPVQIPGYGMLEGIDPELVGTWEGTGTAFLGSYEARLVFRGDGRFTTTHYDPGFTTSNGGNYGIDTGRSPRAVDIVVTESNLGFPPSGQIARGIYEIDGDTLLMGHNMAGDRRPEFLETALNLYVLTRQSDKAVDLQEDHGLEGDASAAVAGAEALAGAAN